MHIRATAKINTYSRAAYWLLVIGLFVAALSVLPSGRAAAIACPTDRGAPITSGYGWRDGRHHNGIDVDVSYRPIYAAESGDVTTQWDDGGYGIYKDLYADNGRLYRYAHLSEGGANGRVNAGNNIGQSGNSGRSTGPHLHWEIRTRPNSEGHWYYTDGTINPAGEFNSACHGSAPAPSGTNPNPTGPVNNPPAPVAPAPNPNDVGSSDCHNLVLRQGNFGGCVRHLQTHLNDFGYRLDLDGDFGPATRSAVRDFQSNRGLGVDGVVGPATWNALHNTPPPQVNYTPSVNNDGNKIVGQGSGRCLDVSGESRSNGAGIIIWGCHGAANQRWRFENGLVKIYDNKCLDVTAFATHDGARVEIYDCHGNTNQRWRYENGMIKIYGNKCLDVTGYGTHDGASVQIYECHGASNQQWSIQQ